MDFKIREDIKPVVDMTEAEKDMYPNVSFGFYNTIDEGDGDLFVELLEDEETKKKCYEAFEILARLESAVKDYIIWG